MPLSHIKLSRGGYFTAKSLALLALGCICLGAGLRYGVQIAGVYPPPEAPGAFVLLDRYLPFRLWGAWWMTAGIMCVVSAWLPHGRPRLERAFRRIPALAWLDALAPALALGITATWAATYWAWFVVGVSPGPYGNSEAWYSAAVWTGVSVLTWASFMAHTRKEAA